MKSPSGRTPKQKSPLFFPESTHNLVLVQLHYRNSTLPEPVIGISEKANCPDNCVRDFNPRPDATADDEAAAIAALGIPLLDEEAKEPACELTAIVNPAFRTDFLLN